MLLFSHFITIGVCFVVYGKDLTLIIILGLIFSCHLNLILQSNISYCSLLVGWLREKYATICFIQIVLGYNIMEKVDIGTRINYGPCLLQLIITGFTGSMNIKQRGH